MGLKKIISLSLILVLVTSIVFSNVAFAENMSEEKIKVMIAAGEIPYESEIKESDVNIKRDQAVEIAKSIIENAESYYLSFSYLTSGWNKKNPMWSLEFYAKDNSADSININIDANTGEITSFNYWKGYHGNNVFIAKYTRDEAKSIAEKFLKKVMKLDLGDFELQDTDDYMYYRTGGVKERIYYNFNYIRKVNNVIFPYSSINIIVDGTNGKVTSYRLNNSVDVDSIEFPVPEKAIPGEEALKEFKKSLNFHLQYILAYDRDPYLYPRGKVILAYVPSDIAYMMIDATTGKALNFDGTELTDFPDVTDQSTANTVPLVPDAKEPKSKAVNEEEANKIALEYKKAVEEILGIQFDENIGYNPYYWDSQYRAWHYSWYKSLENKNIYMSININMDTGRVCNLNIGNYDYEYEKLLKSEEITEDIVEKVSWKQCKDKALELIKKFFPEQYGFYSDQNPNAPELDEYSRKYMRDYSYNFTRVVNGLKFNNDNIYVSIDRTTGEIRSLNFNWSDLKFPEIKDTISVEKAKEMYSDNIAAELNYFLNVTYDESGNQSYSDKAKLVYQFVSRGSRYNAVIVDAVNGKLVDWSGNEITADSSKDLSNLEPHWSKRSAELLMAQGILVKPDFKYDDIVTRKEAVKMMAIAKGIDYSTPYSESSFKDVDVKDPYFVYIESAVKGKIIASSKGNFNGDEKITKAEFAELLTNLIGYGEIAKYNEIYKLPDAVKISGEKAGYAAICHVLGLLPVREGEAFNGEEEVTYGEAAVALYKALEFIR